MVRYVTAALLLALFTPGCNRQAEQVPRETGHLLIGIDPDYPPFEFRDSLSGEIVGFDADLISLICQSNDWHHEVVPTPFEELIDDLNQGKLDIAVSAITVTPERAALISFSDPYYLTGQALAVPLGDSVITELADLRGKRVGVMDGTTGEDLARKTDGVLVYPYSEVAAALVDLAAGRLDAVINDLPASRSALEGIEGVKLVSGTLSAEYYGIAMRTTDTLRMQKVNDALAALVGGYSFELLHKRWFGYPLLDVAVPDSVADQWDTD